MKAPAPAATDALGDLRRAFGEVLGAERRLRSRKKTEPGELTVTQIRAMIPLCQQGSATAGELAKYADLNPASMTAMLDHLEADGFVTRERSEQDRRVVFVSLTAKGHEVIDKRREMWEALWRDALGDLPDADVEAAIRVFARLAEMMDGVGRD